YHDLPRCGGGEPPDHLGGVGGVGDQEHVVRAVQVGDQVVDHAAGRLVQAQRVLRLPGCDPVQVVAQAAVDEPGRTRPGHARLTQVGHVEQADRFAYRRVLF